MSVVDLNTIKNKRLDYCTEAFVITGILDNGEKRYLTYEYDDIPENPGHFEWCSCAFYANFYNTLEEAKAGMMIAEETAYKSIVIIEIELIKTFSSGFLPRKIIQNKENNNE